MTTARRLYRYDEIEAEYGIPVGTLRHWERIKLLPSFRLGRRRFVLRSDLEALIEQARGVNGGSR
jgi:DNA-binding transcriptional MerR regulator